MTLETKKEIKPVQCKQDDFPLEIRATFFGSKLNLDFSPSFVFEDPAPQDYPIFAGAPEEVKVLGILYKKISDETKDNLRKVVYRDSKRL